MTKRWIVLAGLGAAIVLATLLMLFHEGVRNAILVPFVAAYEGAAYVFKSIPQAIIWTILIAAWALYIYQVWPSWRMPNLRRRRAKGPLTGDSEWTLIRLSQMLRDAHKKRSARAAVVRSLAETAVHLIARHHGISPIEARDRLQSKDWTENQEMAEFLGIRTLAEPVPKEGFDEKLRRAITFLESYYQEV